MSPSPSVAVNGAPRVTPAGVFSAIVRVSFANANDGSSFTSLTRIVTVIVVSVLGSASPLASLPSLTDTVTG